VMPPDFTQKYLPEREVINWLEVVTHQSYKQIYDSIYKARKCGLINSRKIINGKKYIHVDSFQKWAVSRRRWKSIFSSFSGFPTEVRVIGVEAALSVGNVHIVSIPQDGELAKKELKELQLKLSKLEIKNKELEKEVRERKNKSKKMSEYGKKARGISKKINYFHPKP